MDAETIRARLMQYPSVMVMKPEYGGGWCIGGRDMDNFFQEVEVLFEEYDTHQLADTKANYETLLKQATSMMIALRQVSGILWKIYDTLFDEGMQHDRSEIEQQSGLLAMEGIDAITGVLKAGALEEKQHCGHERRFVVTGDDHDVDPQGQSDRGKTSWCALCALETRQEDADLRAALKDVANALADTMTTLDLVDPGAPSLEAAEAVMEKHIRIVGPLIEEAREEKG